MVIQRLFNPLFSAIYGSALGEARSADVPTALFIAAYGLGAQGLAPLRLEVEARRFAAESSSLHQINRVRELVLIGSNPRVSGKTRQHVLELAVKSLATSVAHVIDAALALDRVDGARHEEVVGILFKDLPDDIVGELHRRAAFDYLSAKALLYGAEANAKANELVGTMSVEPFRTLLSQVEYWLHADDLIPMEGRSIPRFLAELARLSGTYENADAQELFLSFDLQPIIEQGAFDDEAAAAVARDVLAFLEVAGREDARGRPHRSSSIPPHLLLEERIRMLAAHEGTAVEWGRLAAKVRRQLSGSPELLIAASTFVALLERGVVIEKADERQELTQRVMQLAAAIFRDLTHDELAPLATRVREEQDVEASVALLRAAMANNGVALSLARHMDVGFYRELITPQALHESMDALVQIQDIALPQIMADLFFLQRIGNQSALKLIQRYPLEELSRPLTADAEHYAEMLAVAHRAGRTPLPEVLLHLLFLFADVGRADAVPLMEERTPPPLNDLKTRLFGQLSRESIIAFMRQLHTPFGVFARNALSYISISGHDRIQMSLGPNAS